MNPKKLVLGGAAVATLLLGAIVAFHPNPLIPLPDPPPVAKVKLAAKVCTITMKGELLSTLLLEIQPNDADWNSLDIEMLNADDSSAGNLGTTRKDNSQYLFWSGKDGLASVSLHYYTNGPVTVVGKESYMATIVNSNGVTEHWAGQCDTELPGSFIATRKNR
jgi:hypothetical protein